MTKINTTNKHITNIANLLYSKRRISKQNIISSKEELTDQLHRMVANDAVIIHTNYKYDRLQAFLIQLLSSQGPWWHMTLLGVDSSDSWNYSKNGLEECWGSAFKEAESRSMFQVYWSLPTRWAQTQRKTIQTSKVWTRYQIYEQEVINPGDRPKWSVHIPAYGNTIKNHHVTVKMGVLRNEYRTVNTLSRPE